MGDYPTPEGLTARFGGRSLRVQGRDGFWSLFRAYADVHGTALLVVEPEGSTNPESRIRVIPENVSLV